MAGISTIAAGRERDLLKGAREGNEDAFRRLLEPYRGQLHAHCYRMLGSVQDAEDALQETSLRAWRGLQRFEGRSSLRSWLYTIATNTCLNQIHRRPKQRVLPLDETGPSDPFDGPGMPLAESVWIEPYADAELDYEQRESVELAFVAAVQHLPANQRAALILREVLGFSAAEVAEALGTSVPSVNSALQRARKTVDEHTPDRSQQATLRALGDDELKRIVEDYTDALQRCDVDKVVSLLAEDAAWSMPPAATWYRGLDDLRDFLRLGPLSGAFRWKRLVTHANGQPAVAAYTWVEAEGAYLPFALDVLTLEGDRIKEVTAFITRTTDLPDREAFRRWPDEPLAPRGAEIFTRLGLPDRLD
jgi:RNA polymerase sigma-70 factor, ECF subfamily